MGVRGTAAPELVTDCFSIFGFTSALGSQNVPRSSPLLDIIRNAATAECALHCATLVRHRIMPNLHWPGRARICKRNSVDKGWHLSLKGSRVSEKVRFTLEPLCCDATVPAVVETSFHSSTQAQSKKAGVPDDECSRGSGSLG